MKPKEYLSLTLYLRLPVSKSPSTAFLIGALTKCFIPSTSVKSLGTTRGTLDTEATNIGTTDIQVLADFTGTDGDGTTGNATVTVMYMQNNSIADAGNTP